MYIYTCTHGSGILIHQCLRKEFAVPGIKGLTELSGLHHIHNSVLVSVQHVIQAEHFTQVMAAYTHYNILSEKSSKKIFTDRCITHLRSIQQLIPEWVSESHSTQTSGGDEQTV